MQNFVSLRIVACLVGVVLCSCSQTSQPDGPSATMASKASNVEPILAGELMDDQIMSEFAIYYLPTPTKEPLSELDELLKDKFKRFQKVDKIAPPKAGMVVAALPRGGQHPGRLAELQHVDAV